MSNEKDKYYSINKDGSIKINGNTIPYNEAMKKQRIVNAIEEYIECPCGSEMKFVAMIQCAGIWECIKCKQRTATIYNVLNLIRKVKEQ